MEAWLKFKFAFFLTYFYSYISVSFSTKAAYEEITSPKEVKDTTLSSMFHKSFHQCSLGEDCNFVVKKITSNTYSLVKKAGDLPKLDGTVRLWKKIVMQKDAKQEPTNLALNKPALFSAVYDEGNLFPKFEPNRAVDGKKNNDDFNLCAISELSTTAWFRVDLEAPANVYEIKIIAGSTVLEKLDIRVGNSQQYSTNPLCQHAVAIGKTEIKTYVCNDSKGRYVSLHLDVYGYLQLCEIEVFGAYQ